MRSEKNLIKSFVNSEINPIFAVAMNYRLTIEDLKEMVTESLVSLYMKQPLLVEYAHSRNAFGVRAMGYIEPIVTHYALCHYSFYNGEKELLGYWKKELSKFMVEVNKLSIKPRDNRKIVEKLLKDEFITGAELKKDSSKYYDDIDDKFEEEGMELDDVFKKEIIHAFQADLDDMIQVMSYGSRENNKKYIDDKWK